MATLVLRKNTVHFDSNTHAPVAGFEKGERDDKGMLFDLNCICSSERLSQNSMTPVIMLKDITQYRSLCECKQKRTKNDAEVSKKDRYQK
jgi:hypothetical protein